MSVKLRLARFGKKGYVTYRIIAVDERKKRNGMYLENVGTYNPMTNPATVLVKEDRIAFWVKQGAQYSEGLRKLLKHKKH